MIVLTICFPIVFFNVAGIVVDVVDDDDDDNDVDDNDDNDDDDNDDDDNDDDNEAPDFSELSQEMTFQEKMKK